jgi:ATP-dependent RNA helicase DHR2
MTPSRGTKRTANGNVKYQGLTNGNGIVSSNASSRGKVVNFNDDEPQVGKASAATNQPSKLRQRAEELKVSRQQLPIWTSANEIRSKLRAHDTLLLVAETGSGKSTQVPQFLVNETWCKVKRLHNGSSVGGCIAITEPRRVAAISLARRVAEEMGTPLGTASPASQVGYSVRFDNSTGPATRIKLLTEGMLLQEMLRDPWLKQYSAVIVDEVHERGLNVDMVLGFLRRMQERSHAGDERGGNKMKVIVMSATADMERIKGYLKQATATVDEEAEEEWNGFSDDEGTSSAREATKLDPVASLVIKGRQHPVTINYAPTPVSDILEATLQRITQIHAHAPLPGDILVFLTGQETVESLLSLVESYAVSVLKDPNLSSTLPSLLILPLYAALPPHLQQRVFQPTPKFTRKIIIATNIAETSITVPGIRFVIDSGKHKRRLFRASLNLDSLLTVPISRSSANQRSGRAGRDAPGTAYRLYTEQAYYSLAADTEPEILRCDLSQLVLILKSHGVDDLSSFPLLTAPPRKALERAIMHLLQLGALDRKTGAITSLGREMSLLPLPSHLARILLSSSLPQYNCVDEIIDIVSALSVENIFLNIHHEHTEANDDVDDNENPSDPRLALRSRLHRREGDHLTLLATVQAYVDENADRKRWCEDRGISHRAMQAVMDARKQLTNIMKRREQEQERQRRVKGNEKSDMTKNAEGATSKTGTAKKKERTTEKEPGTLQKQQPTTTSPDLTTRILQTLLTGLHPNVARLSLTPANNTNKPSTSSPSSAQYTTLQTHQPISIHPSSVLFTSTLPSTASRNGVPTRLRPEAIMSSEYVFTTKPYARCVSAVQLDWVRDVVESEGVNGFGGGEVETG